eukprot:6430579-Amphidinium_carterae.1
MASSKGALASDLMRMPSGHASDILCHKVLSASCNCSRLTREKPAGDALSRCSKSSSTHLECTW